MKLIQQEEDDIHYIVDADTDVWEIVEKICTTGPSDVPIYICNVDDIVLKHKNWLAKLPRVVPHYAVKCNDSNIVLATLAALGTSFDCASKAEISKVLSLGVAPERIIFAQPAKPATHLRYASTVNVQQMTVDSEVELHKIKRLYPDAKCVIRIRCDASEAQCPLGKKFGCDPFTEAPHLIKVARSLNLDVIGISFHVGSGCSDYPIFATAIRICKDLFEYAENIGYDFSLLDLGGGFHGDKGKSIDEVATVINQALDKFFPVDGGVRIIAEPGRYYVSSAYTLITNIHSKKEIVSPITGDSRMMYYLNDGVYGSFNSMLYDHQICVPKLLKEQADRAADKTYASTIFGPSCDALDTINENVELPDLAIGDFVIWENMGAYTMVCASPFNGFPIPKTHIYAGRETWEMLKSLLPADNEYMKLIAANMHHTDNILFA